ncbi:MAG: hypothetical protein L0Z51_02095 [Candidatus Latescibacteria bacterium]|nr:hypothetical protein [Candidatus Latescibacterota bacterium]
MATPLATTARAHDGHGDPRWTGSLLHVFLEPEHAWIGVVIATLAAVLLVRRFGTRRRPWIDKRS